MHCTARFTITAPSHADAVWSRAGAQVAVRDGWNAAPPRCLLPPAPDLPRAILRHRPTQRTLRKDLPLDVRFVRVCRAAAATILPSSILAAATAACRWDDATRTRYAGGFAGLGSNARRVIPATGRPCSFRLARVGTTIWPAGVCALRRLPYWRCYRDTDRRAGHRRVTRRRRNGLACRYAFCGGFRACRAAPY